MSELLKELGAAGFRGEISIDEPLRLHTSLKVGGPADIFARPADTDDLLLLVSVLNKHSIDMTVIGGGFNLLAMDDGFRGCVISLKKLDRISHHGDGRVIAESGALNSALVTFCKEKSLGGAEFLCGIPGSIGGALVMNAGAHGSAVMGIAAGVTLLRKGSLITLSRMELDFGYRYLTLEKGDIVTSGEFQLKSSTREDISGNISRFREYRKENQAVTEPNAGSFFKNPPNEAAWKLIDGAGMRGVSVGGAKVAESHANYLVNTGGATASDFLELSAMIKAKVWDKYRIQLESEVRILGS